MLASFETVKNLLKDGELKCDTGNPVCDRCKMKELLGVSYAKRAPHDCIPHLLLSRLADEEYEGLSFERNDFYQMVCLSEPENDVWYRRWFLLYNSPERSTIVLLTPHHVDWDFADFEQVPLSELFEKFYNQGN